MSHWHDERFDPEIPAPSRKGAWVEIAPSIINAITSLSLLVCALYGRWRVEGAWASIAAAEHRLQAERAALESGGWAHMHQIGEGPEECPRCRLRWIVRPSLCVPMALHRGAAQ